MEPIEYASKTLEDSFHSSGQISTECLSPAIRDGRPQRVSEIFKGSVFFSHTVEKHHCYYRKMGLTIVEDVELEASPGSSQNNT